MAFPSPPDFRARAMGSAWWRVGGTYAGRDSVRVCSSESAAVILYAKEYLRQTLGRDLWTHEPRRIDSAGDPTGVATLTHVKPENILPTPRWDIQTLAGFAAVLTRARLEAEGYPMRLGFRRRRLDISAFAGRLNELREIVISDAMRNTVSAETLRVVLFLTFRRAISDSSNPITIDHLGVPPNTVLPRYGEIIQEPEAFPEGYRPVRCREEFGAPTEGDENAGPIIPIPPTFGLNPPIPASGQGASVRTKATLIGLAGAAVGVYLGMRPPKKKRPTGTIEVDTQALPQDGGPILVREETPKPPGPSKRVVVQPHARRKRRWQKRPEDKIPELEPKRSPSVPRGVRLPSQERLRTGLYWAQVARDSE